MSNLHFPIRFIKKLLKKYYHFIKDLYNFALVKCFDSSEN